MVKLTPVGLVSLRSDYARWMLLSTCLAQWPARHPTEKIYFHISKRNTHVFSVQARALSIRSRRFISFLFSKVDVLDSVYRVHVV